eukprot:5508244-Ditylum_brightwellii.AAC.1
MGLPKNICKLYRKTLEQMEYKMKTAYRESEESNKSRKNNRLNKSDQGACDSPIDWIMTS